MPHPQEPPDIEKLEAERKVAALIATLGLPPLDLPRLPPIPGLTAAPDPPQIDLFTPDFTRRGDAMDAGQSQDPSSQHESDEPPARGGAYAELVASLAEERARLAPLEQTGGVVQRRVLEGHQGVVSGVAYSPDGNSFASCSEDSTVRVWDERTGKLLATLQSDGQKCGVTWHPDGDYVASAANCTVEVWDVSNRNLAATMRSANRHVALTGVAWSPAGDRIAAGCSDGSVVVWDAYSAKRTALLATHRASVHAVAWSPDGDRIASVGDVNDATLRVWDAGTGELVATRETDGYRILGVAWSPAGDLIATGGDTLRVWDPPRRQRLPAWLHAKRGPVRPTELAGSVDGVAVVAFSPDEELLASAHADRNLLIWDRSGRRLSCTPMGGEIHSLDWGDSGIIVGVGHGGHIAQLHVAESHKRLWRRSPPLRADGYTPPTSRS